MISLLLEDMTFEQDIRELLMAFYPEEKYIYTNEDVFLSLFLSKKVLNIISKSKVKTMYWSLVHHLEKQNLIPKMI